MSLLVTGADLGKILRGDLYAYNKDFMTFLGKLLGLFLDGGGAIRNSDVTNLNFLSHNFLFHLFLRLLRTYMPMTAKREVHRLSEYLIVCVGGSAPPPPPPPSVLIVFCSSSRPHCLPQL